MTMPKAKLLSELFLIEEVQLWLHYKWSNINQKINFKKEREIEVKLWNGGQFGGQNNHNTDIQQVTN